LGGKVIGPVAQANELECVGGVHRIDRNLGDDGDVLSRREAWDEVIELENEPDVVTPWSAYGKRDR